MNCDVPYCEAPRHKRGPGTTDKPSYCTRHNAIYERARKLPRGRLVTLAMAMMDVIDPRDDES